MIYITSIIKVSYSIIATLVNVMFIFDFLCMHYSREIELHCILFIISNCLIFVVNRVLLEGNNISKAIGLLCYIEFVVSMFNNNIIYFAPSTNLIFELHSLMSGKHTLIYPYIFMIVAVMFLMQLVYVIINKSEERFILFEHVNRRTLLVFLSGLLMLISMNLDMYQVSDNSLASFPLALDSYSNHQMVVNLVLLMLIIVVGEGRGSVLVALNMIVIYVSLL